MGREKLGCSRERRIAGMRRSMHAGRQPFRVPDSQLLGWCYLDLWIVVYSLILSTASGFSFVSRKLSQQRSLSDRQRCTAGSICLRHKSFEKQNHASAPLYDDLWYITDNDARKRREDTSAGRSRCLLGPLRTTTRSLQHAQVKGETGMAQR